MRGLVASVERGGGVRSLICSRGHEGENGDRPLALYATGARIAAARDAAFHDGALKATILS